MYFRVANPAFLCFLPILFAAFLIFVKREKHFRALLKEMAVFEGEKFFSFFSAVSTWFFFMFFLFALLSLSGIYVGQKVIKTKKTSSLLSIVADVSYSMNAKDGLSSKSRLESLKNFLNENLSSLHSRTALIAAKGDGVCLVPHTFDKSALGNTISSLNPFVMTNKGSSIGKGVLCALGQAKKNKNFSHVIWLLTDGGETDNFLLPALLEAKKANTKVFIIGFGDEKESEVLTGDGKTRVRTRLNKAHILSVISEANKKLKNPLFFFVDSNDKNAKSSLLSGLNTNGEFFEAEEVPREITPFFIRLALICFILSIIFKYRVARK